MNILAPKGLHHGVFQGLDSKYCKHNFYTDGWNILEKPMPNNVFILGKEHTDIDFFGAILVQSIEDYYRASKYNKPIIYYDLMNGRGEGPKEIYNDKRVVPLFISTSCRTSHGVFNRKHKTIYPGIDEDFWNGWHGGSPKIIHVRNGFKERDLEKYNDFLNICGINEYTLVGRGGNVTCGYEELRTQFQSHRVFVNVEINLSTFSISSMEAMMTGLPIICNDIESTGEAIRNGMEGFISNNIGYLKRKTNDLLNDWEMAKELGANARNMAKIKFSKKQFNLAWDDFLNNLDSYLG